MPADRLDLAARLAAATPQDTIHGLAINAAFGVVREHADEATVLLCDPTGTGKRSATAACPMTEALPVLWATADRLERVLGSPDEVLFRIGYRAAEVALSSMFGLSLLASGRTPRALLGRVPGDFKAATGYGQRYVTWEGEHAARLEFDHEFLPLAYLRGALRARLDAAGAQAAEVEGQAPGFMRAAFQVRWG